MARSFEKIVDINDTEELWKISVKVHHKWTVISNDKEHMELIFVDADGTYVHVIVPTTLKATYKIENEVVDNGSSSIFVFWDRECNELLEIFVSQLRQTMLQDGIHDPLEFPLVLDNLIGHEFAFKVKWQPRWKNESVMAVIHDKETIDKLLAKWEVCKDLEITYKLNSQLLPSDPSAIMVDFSLLFVMTWLRFMCTIIGNAWFGPAPGLRGLQTPNLLRMGIVELWL
ncbi:hypothetical protein KIW84_043080 [Lathyrus oleraceus]|uniref:Replication protein A 70 kDa DNA-binding subunit B/D first OB fold domain-containing protein n=1 Tax=Pisum sativum TaxID=3888 RepID=A0A9D4XE97_PEA|nr:hypothetical protein KIW84_043080 [Pisum sativum]